MHILTLCVYSVNVSSDERREQILQSALLTFGQYGYRRTTMGDLAAAAGISRPALYLLFRNKEDVFRSCAEWLLDLACRTAEQALQASSTPFPERLVVAVEERFIFLYQRLHLLPHAQELLDLGSTIAPDITHHMEVRTLDALTHAVAEADARGELALQRVGLSARVWAELLISGLHGLKTSLTPDERFADRARELVRVFCTAVAPLP